MAEKRMISISLVDDDRFLDMSPGAQLLYFHISARADDDGFFSSRKLLRTVNSKRVSLDELIRNGYVLMFDSGVGCIVHWFANNTIQKDRYKPSEYPEKELVELVTIGNRKEYRLKAVSKMETEEAVADGHDGNGMETDCIQIGNSMDAERNQDGNKMITQDRTDNSLSVLQEERVCLLRRQDKKEESDLSNSMSVNCPEPTIGEVQEFVRANGLDVDAEEFFRACERDGWTCQGKRIRDWKALIRSWSRTGVASRQKIAAKVLGGGCDGEDLPYGSYRL